MTACADRFGMPEYPPGDVRWDADELLKDIGKATAKLKTAGADAA